MKTVISLPNNSSVSFPNSNNLITVKVLVGSGFSNLATIAYSGNSQDLAGNLPINLFNNGLDAGNNTFWRGDGTWAQHHGNQTNTNLSYTASPIGGIIASDTGTDASLSLSDGTNAGLMSPSQHGKLSKISFDMLTVTQLPSPTTVGLRYFVSDCASSTFYSIVDSGGANRVPVYSDGINWRVG